jgi:adenylate cyclase
LVPNIETDLRSGQRLLVAPDVEFVIEGEAVAAREDPTTATVAMPDSAFATLLVGDIRDYTVLVRRAPSAVLQQSVSRVFEALSTIVGEQGGTVKEYQGDALVAFWEGDVKGRQVMKACRAALALDVAVKRLAADRSIWQVDDFALGMDFALATGPVLIDSFGGSQVTGLSMVGEPIVLAFRLEKFANAERGRILACRVTRQMAGTGLRFRDLGEMIAKGFDQPDRVYALDGVQPDETATTQPEPR